MDDFEVQCVAAIFALVLGVIAVVVFAIVQDSRHTEYLRKHGCELVTTAPTGRNVYCGKACFRPEEVYVYDCADGPRLELH